MKKILSFVVGIGLFVLVLIPATGLSYTIQNIGPNGSYYYTNSGDYLGTVLGENDSLSTVQAVLNELGYSVTLTDFAKVEAGNSSSTEGSFSLFVTYYGDGSGQWATFSPVTPSPIPAGAQLVDFYVVKGGPNFALYQEDPASAYGTWNIGNLVPNPQGVPSGISHFSGYATTTTGVPEPTTLLLVGSGLVGIGILGRKRYGKVKS